MNKEEFEKLIEDVIMAVSYSKVHTKEEKQKILELIDKLLDTICE